MFIYQRIIYVHEIIEGKSTPSLSYSSGILCNFWTFSSPPLHHHLAILLEQDVAFDQFQILNQPGTAVYNSFVAFSRLELPTISIFITEKRGGDLRNPFQGLAAGAEITRHPHSVVSPVRPHHSHVVVNIHHSPLAM